MCEQSKHEQDVLLCLYGRWEVLHPMMSLWQMGRALPWTSYVFVSGGYRFARLQTSYVFVADGKTSYDVFVADGETFYDVFMADRKSFAMDVQ